MLLEVLWESNDGLEVFISCAEAVKIIKYLKLILVLILMKDYGFTKGELRTLRNLNTPAKTQDFIDGLHYNFEEDGYHSPRWVLRERKAECFSGAIFAATVMRVNGYEPLIIDLKAERDEDHVLAVYRFNGFWGAMGKSKFITLKYREPIFRSIGGLARSYVDFYHNFAYQKSLREYSGPLNLSTFDRLNWMTTEESLEFIADRLEEIQHFKILPKGMERKLRTVDRFLFKKGMLERRRK